jgi:hypothetical protein
MCLSEQNGLHGGAVKWYYEFVAGCGPGVPEAIVRHIRRCLVCRKQIERLVEAVTGAGGETDRSRFTMKRDVIDTLSLHFGCLEERVTCGRVRPFLPGLLMPSARIRIPTPITVHIDHCPECADDLNALRDLGLTAGQLERLERLYGWDSLGTSPRHGLRMDSAGPALVRPRLRLGEALRCRRARTRIAAFVRGRLEDLGTETLNHLCTCPRCRPHVHRSRQRLLESEPNGTAGAPAVCAEETPTARLFDYAVPYGRTADRQDRADESHVGTCRACLRKIQELDETIYGIAERTNSGVATVYSTVEHDALPQHIVPTHNDLSNGSRVEDMEAGPIAGSSIGLYPDYPIRVQVIHGAPQQTAAAAWKSTAFDPRVRFLLKTAVAAAAMIPLALIFLNTSPASGTTLAQVVKAFGKAQNVHITQFYPNTGRVSQELWISREADVVLTVEGRERIMYDLARRKKYISQTLGSSANAMDLNEREFMSARLLMDSFLGFTSKDIPRGAQWTHIEDDAAEGVEIYELTCTEQSNSGATSSSWMWKIRIDAVTRRPAEIYRFRKVPREDQWHCLQQTKFQYITADEIATVFKE